jgi:lysophospholipase L1-like esterase
MQLLSPAPPRDEQGISQSAAVYHKNGPCMREAVRRRTVVCVGDSLVRGQVGVSFVDMLRQRLGEDSFRFINAGVNGDLSYNVLARLDAVIACRPDFVVILAGSNDVNATLSPGIRLGYRLWKRLPEEPAMGWCHGNMLCIVRLLKQRTSARIAITSPPVLGEDLDSLPNRRVREYCALLREIAIAEGASYLPVHERQEEYLCQVNRAAGPAHDANSLIMYTSLFRYYVLKHSFDDIAEENGFVLTTEGMHLNGRGAAIVADEVESFLRARI